VVDDQDLRLEGSDEEDGPAVRGHADPAVPFGVGMLLVSLLAERETTDANVSSSFSV
jgi:hypothetical protein